MRDLFLKCDGADELISAGGRFVSAWRDQIPDTAYAITICITGLLIFDVVIQRPAIIGYLGSAIGECGCTKLGCVHAGTRDWCAIGQQWRPALCTISTASRCAGQSFVNR